MKLVLEPIFEADFHPCSYGYRLQRDAKMASTAIRNDLYRGAWGVVEIDFRSYFTTIPHDKLIILIKQRVVDVGGLLSGSFSGGTVDPGSGADFGAAPGA